MSFYAFVLLWVFGCSILSVDKYYKVYKKIFLIAILFLLIPLAGFRYNIGVDYDSYLVHYESIENILNYQKLYSSMEIGYEYLVSLFKTFNAPFYIFTLFIAFVTLSILGNLVLRFSLYPILSVLMFFSLSFWGQVMGQMRQPLAILMLYSFLHFLEYNKLTKFALVIIAVGFLFHKSVLILLFPLFFLKIQRTTICYYCILFFFIVLGYELIPIISFVLNYFPTDFPFATSIIGYLTYNGKPVDFTMGMIERFTMFSIITYYTNKYNALNKNNFNLICYNLYFFGVCFYFLFIHVSSEIAARGTYPLTYVMFFLFPNILKLIRGKKDYIIFLSIILSWSLYLAINVFFLGDLFIPYKSIFL